LGVSVIGWGLLGFVGVGVSRFGYGFPP